MRHVYLRRLAALCLAVLLIVPAYAAAPERQADLDFLYGQVLTKAHPNAFANTPESEFLALKAEIESRLDSESDTAFLLDLMRLTALVGDSHTSLSVGSAGDFRGYPFSLVRRGDAWYLAAAPKEQGALVGREVTAIAGKPVAETVAAFGTLFGSDNPVHLRRQFRSACNIADIYEYLGLTEPGAPLEVTVQGGETLRLEPQSMETFSSVALARLADQITGQPETAGTDANYAARPLSDQTYYIEYNACKEDEDLPMETFTAQVGEALAAGRYRRVLIDLRRNGGGSDGVLIPLLEALRQRQYAGAEFQIVGLIGEATFSSALINAVEIQEFGGVLAGESAGGSVSHFGAVRTFALPNSKVRGQVSSKYIDLNSLLDAAAGRGVEALTPDVEVPQTLEDTLRGHDTLVDWLESHPEPLSPKAYPAAPLTRGRFLGMLYEAAGSPEVTVEKSFKDGLGGLEWYAPALTWAKAAGIARGYGDGTFRASQPITWQQAEAFLSRAPEALQAEIPTGAAGNMTRAEGSALLA